VLPPEYDVVIPFGESGFGDGRTCLGCLRAAYRWRDDVARNDFVVVFDTNLRREGRTCPGGLELYGKLAALEAGRPGNFAQFYAALANVDAEPPRPGPLWDPAHDDPASYLIRRIEAAQPATILWDFEEPTTWERWLAGELVAAGGTRRSVEARLTRGIDRPARAEDADGGNTSAATGSGIVVATAWERREDAYRVLRNLTAAASPRREDCIRRDSGEAHLVPAPAFLLAASPAPDGSVPAWIVGTWHDVIAGQSTAAGVPCDMLFVGDPVAIAYEPGAERPLHVLLRPGVFVALRPGDGQARTGNLRVAGPLGLGCGAFVDGRWWAVDAVTGRIFTERGAFTPPAGPWAGIARGPDDELVLASAEQEIRVFDVRRGTEIRRFPAHVWPSRRVDFLECSPIVAGDGWFGSYDHFSGTLNVYDHVGAELATVPLDARGSLAIAASGSYIGVGFSGAIRTRQLADLADCTRSD